jgi:hypothetical protein
MIQTSPQRSNPKHKQKIFPAKKRETTARKTADLFYDLFLTI